MKVNILLEAGHDLALRGMAYSYKDRAIDPADWWSPQRERALKRAPLLAPLDAGHNKFLRQIALWIDIEACRTFWSEFDTYKVGVVANSESTMHTLAKRAPRFDDFEVGTDASVISEFCHLHLRAKGDINTLKLNLPEGFLQRRMVTLNYGVLRNIIAQRRGHRLKWWGVFITEVMAQVAHPEYLRDLLNEPQ